jgi:type IV secretion system protein VirD4
MQRRLSTQAVLGAFVLALCGSGTALAQNHGFDDFDFLARLLPSHQEPATTDQMLQRLGINIAAAVAGLAVGAFLSPMLRPLRRFIFVALLVAGVAFAWFGPAPLADTLANVVAVFCFFIALGMAIRLGFKPVVADPEEPPTSFGTAKWATEAYLRDHGLFDGQGFLLGEFFSPNDRNLLHYSGARHLLTVAPTRSGKGVASIIPNLLTYQGSAFVIDPKGENAIITAARRGRGDAARRIPGLGQSVFLVDPWNIAAADLGLRPARFNPLDWIKADDPDAAENAFLLADALVPGESDGEARFWDEEAKALLTGVILYVATSKKEAANRNLGRVRDILLLDDDGFKAALTDMFNEPLPVIASTAARTAGKDPKLRSNVLAAVQSHTHFLDSPRIRESLILSDFNFENLKTQPMTVYLILPADRLKTFDRWLRLLIQQAITVNARNIAIKPEKPVLFLLDEMPSLGRLSMVEQAYGLMAGFGMQLWGIVQDLSQLERIYGDGWQTFISNSGVIQYFGSRDKITAEYFSTLCGVTTVATRTSSHALGSVFGTSSSHSSGPGGSTSGSGSNESSSHTHTVGLNESQRQLAYPDELMVLKDYAQIVFVDNLDPIRGAKIRWHANPDLRPLGVNLHPEPEPPAIDPSGPQAAAPKPKPAPAPRKKTVKETLQNVADRIRAAFRKRADKTPEPPAPAPAARPMPEPPKPPPMEVDRYESGDITYVMYSDGAVEVRTPDGSQRFPSLAALRAASVSQ